MGELVKHAEYELALLGYARQDAEPLLNVLQTFEAIDHVPGTLHITTQVLIKLIEHKSLSPLTDNPDEWEEFGGKNETGYPGPMWRSRRDVEAYSFDRGHTYYRVTENTRRFDGSVKLHFHPTLHFFQYADKV